MMVGHKAWCWVVVIIAILSCSPVALAQQATHYIVPFVEPGSEVLVSNGDKAQTIIIVIGDWFEKRELRKWETVRIIAKSRGFVRFGRTYSVNAWSVVRGTMFPGVLLNSTGRVFAVTPETGIAVANPFPDDVRATLWLFHGETVTAVEMTIPALGQYVGFLNLPDGTAVLASTQPLAVGVARCRQTICESVPVATIGGQ